MHLPFSPSHGPFRWRLPKHDTNAAEPEKWISIRGVLAEENRGGGKMKKGSHHHLAAVSSSRAWALVLPAFLGCGDAGGRGLDTMVAVLTARPRLPPASLGGHVRGVFHVASSSLSRPPSHPTPFASRRHSLHCLEQDGEQSKPRLPRGYDHKWRRPSFLPSSLPSYAASIRSSFRPHALTPSSSPLPTHTHNHTGKGPALQLPFL